MRANGDTYFTGRETTNKNIQDQQLPKHRGDPPSLPAEGLRQRPRILARCGRYASRRRTGRISDQITFLGSDLTPTAMTALKPAADKLNAQGDDVLKKIDDANAGLRTYLDGLRGVSVVRP